MKRVPMKIAVLAGDGIGPEITAQAVRVLQALAAGGLDITLESALVGGAAVDACGDPLPAETLRVCESADAILFGAVGGPRYDTLPRAQRPEQGLLRLRKHFDLFANLRPAVVYPELAHASTLKPEVVAGLDLLLSGLCLRVGGQLLKGPYLPETTAGLMRTTRALTGRS